MGPNAYPAVMAQQMMSQSTADSVEAAIRSGNVGETNLRILYSRQRFAGVTPIAGNTYTFFQQTRTTNPENSNVFEIGKMGVNERFIVQGISIVLGGTSTLAGIQSFSQEARLTLSIGPDDIEKHRLPLVFLPSPLGWIFGASAPTSKANTVYDFYRLEAKQAVTLFEGQPFNVRIVQGAAAPALAAPDVVDLFVCLHGAYIQNVVRG